MNEFQFLDTLHRFESGDELGRVDKQEFCQYIRDLISGYVEPDVKESIEEKLKEAKALASLFIKITTSKDYKKLIDDAETIDEDDDYELMG